MNRISNMHDLEVLLAHAAQLGMAVRARSVYSHVLDKDLDVSLCTLEMESTATDRPPGSPMLGVAHGLCAISPPVLVECASLVSELVPLGSEAVACESPPTISVVIEEEHELAAVVASATDVDMPAYIRLFGRRSASISNRRGIVVELMLHPYRSASRAVSFLDTLLVIQTERGRLTELRAAEIDRRLNSIDALVERIEGADPCGLTMWGGLPVIEHEWHETFKERLPNRNQAANE